MITALPRFPNPSVFFTVFLFTLVVSFAPGANAAGTVGTGTAGSCTEAALNTALGGGGTVNFNCGAAPITIAVTGTKLINATTTIDGGNLVTLSGGSLVGIIQMNNAPITLTISNISLINGNAGVGSGGAISNGFGTNTINIQNSTIANNTAQGGGGIITSGSSLSISGSTFSGNNGGVGSGGAIRSSVTATITNSTFSGNTAGAGAAIYTDGNMTINNSTIASNNATSNLGSINLGVGPITVTLTNSIVASNTGNNCTISGGSSVVNGGNNLQFGDTTCGAGITTADPLLGPLQINSPGATATRALPAGSPAINAGNNGTCAATDQRGISRPQGAVCDIGAYEYVTPVVVAATPVPALSEWALLMLAGVLGLWGLTSIRREG